MTGTVGEPWSWAGLGAPRPRCLSHSLVTGKRGRWAATPTLHPQWSVLPFLIWMLRPFPSAPMLCSVLLGAHRPPPPSALQSPLAPGGLVCLPHLCRPPLLTAWHPRGTVWSLLPHRDTLSSGFYLCEATPVWATPSLTPPQVSGEREPCNTPGAQPQARSLHKYTRSPRVCQALC